MFICSSMLEEVMIYGPPFLMARDHRATHSFEFRFIKRALHFPSFANPL